MDYEKMDFANQDERRKFRRFQSTAFLGVPLHLTPLPPFFGDPIDGQVMNLSAGGMAILIAEALPQNSRLFMELTFPNHKVFASTVIVRNVVKSKVGFLIGIEFLDLPQVLMTLLDQMAIDHIECDDRIARAQGDICITTCSFFDICEKLEKKRNVKGTDPTLHLKLTSVPK